MYKGKNDKDWYDLSEKIRSGEKKFPEDPAREITLLRDVLRFHEWKYYVLKKPVISDAEYDQLYDRLLKLESKHPELITPDSPTQRVATDLVDSFQTVDHLSPMLSLSNSYNIEDLKDWVSSLRKLIDISTDMDLDFCVEPKFDGGSVSVVYENNSYIRGATRGDGFKGEDITPNMKTLYTIPLNINWKKYGVKLIELRGEALINKKTFVEMNKEREKSGRSLFASPRNAASGSLRMKDPNSTAERNIEVVLYSSGAIEYESGASEPETHYEILKAMDELGYHSTYHEAKVCRGITEVMEFIREWEEKREDYHYEIDGMVIKLNKLDLQKQAGSTSHHPRWAMAYKFKARQATSRLKDVVYQVGKIGSVTPVAKIDPVELSGATITSVSLHNEDFIRDKDIRIGDTVLVERAGDVIPYIVKPLPELRDGSEKVIEYPSHCPCPLNSELVREEAEAAWRCVHPDCPRQTIRRLIHFVSKSGMDIDGLGIKQIEKFYELGWLNNYVDIFRLDYDKILALEGYKEKSVQNLKKAIEAAKHRPLSHLLKSLSIHHLGPRAAKVIAAHVKDIWELSNKTLDDLQNLPDIGPVLAGNVMEYFSDDGHLKKLEELQKLGVNMKQSEADRPVKANKSSPLYGKTILFTGTLNNLTRNDAKQMAENAGAKNISSVSGNLDILVAGEKAGSKLTKAKEKNVEIWDEKTFLNHINHS